MTAVNPFSEAIADTNSGGNCAEAGEILPLEHFYVTCREAAVAEGVVLPSGAFALSWSGELHTHGTYPSLAVFQRIQAQMRGRKIVPGKQLYASLGKPPSEAAQRTFYLQRHEDWNGISGTGTVAIGFEFDQIAVVQWRGKEGSTVWYESIGAVEGVHGHSGRTQVVRVVDSVSASVSNSVRR